MNYIKIPGSEFSYIFSLGSRLYPYNLSLTHTEWPISYNIRTYMTPFFNDLFIIDKVITKTGGCLERHFTYDMALMERRLDHRPSRIF